MRVLVHAPVDMNLIDGSAIWVASVTQMLLHEPDLSVDLLLNSPLKRQINLEWTRGHQRVRLLDPWSPGGLEPLRLKGISGKRPRLEPGQAFELIQRLDEHQRYHLIILRGGPITRLAAAVPTLAARCWFYITAGGAEPETLEALAGCNGRLLVQTPLLQEYLERLLGPGGGRFLPLPPMVPRLLETRPREARRGRRLCYVGKFEADYMIEEMLALFAELHRRFPDAEFVIAGDKFHDPERTGRFEQRVRRLLADTPGVVWRGGMSREEVGRLMQACDLGACWRSARYDDSLELSTKALEYAAAGLPVLLNPSRINRQVFSADYPLYVRSAEDFVAQVSAAFEDDTLYRAAARMAHETARRFTFEATHAALQSWLAEYRPGHRVTVETRRPLRILFAGHDLKFARGIIDHFSAHPDCLVRTDTWTGHETHDEDRSLQSLTWADVIWCEWCLGNAVWYSARCRPSQRLVIRLHRQECVTPFPERVHWERVHHLIFIAPHVRDDITARVRLPEATRVHLIYNVVDCAAFAAADSAERRRRLGLLGYCPKLKHPRLALEILRKLRETDAAWRLYLGGRNPREYAWLWRRPEERDYYEHFERELAQAGEAVACQGWTDDAPAWYAQVGFILSCSDLEGSHQAVAEGMAAGCVPVVRRWRGAALMYPRALLFETAEEAVRLIREAADGRWETLSTQAREEARARFDRSVILPQLETLVLGVGAGKTPTVSLASH